MKKGSLRQFIKFGLVGVSNTLVSQIIYMICITLGLHYVAANTIAFVLSVLHAYFWQNMVVFKEDESKEKRVWWQVLLKTYAAYSFTGLFLNNVLLVFWIKAVNIERFMGPAADMINGLGINIDSHTLTLYAAPMFNAVINVPLNFVINKFWAYRQKSKEKE